MQQPPLPDGSLPGTQPYVPTAPLPPGHVPPGAPQADLSRVALAASLVMLFLPPMLLIMGWDLGNSSSSTFDILTWMLAGAGVLCIATFVLALVAVMRAKKGQAGRTTMAVAALVISILAPFPTLGVWLFSVLIMSAGHGRPLRRGDGRPVVTPKAADDRWSAAAVAPHVAGLDAATRAALGRAWSEDAALEHASIAAFAKLALDLVALGAPPELLAGAHRAALEEVEHARVAYAFASAYAGVAVGAGPMPDAGASVPEPCADRAARVVFESVVDGMIGESAAARIAAIVARRTEDPVVRAALERVAKDEATHADLAEAVVAWCAASHPAATSRGIERAASALRAIPSASLSTLDTTALPGRPSASEIASARRDEIDRVTDWIAQRRLPAAA